MLETNDVFNIDTLSSKFESALLCGKTLHFCIFLIRFVVGSNRVIFMLRDGSYAWEVKDFLVAQDRCEDVTVEGQVFPGKAATKDAKGNKPDETKKKGDKKAANRANKSKQELWYTSLKGTASEWDWRSVSLTGVTRYCDTQANHQSLFQFLWFVLL